MRNWNNIWVYGYKTALEQFLETKKTDGKLPHEILCVGPIYPHEIGEVLPNGIQTYNRKSGAVKCLWLFSLYGDAEDLIDEFKVLNGPYTIHENMTIEEIRELYPAFTLGQGIPYIC